ncbi:MAG: hypothetical protein J6S05_05435 [Bacteroidaceae bacterium]|nr:hypothetical protein [Bacteroidaceae bacterium]
MSVTIDSLDIQIRSSAGSAAKNIGDLARELGNLNQNAKVTKIVNSLERLNGALGNMKTNISTMSHLSAMSKSLSSLAALPKLDGLRSAINELKKLPAVTQSLDTAEITQFASKMKMLATGLSPLATQIDKISKGFAKLPPQVSKCVTAVKRLDSANKSVTKSTQAHGGALNTQSLNLMTVYENLSNVFGMMHGIQDAIAKVLNDAIQWDSVQARFGRSMGDSAEEYLAYVQKLNAVLGINEQQFMSYSSLFADMMRGFGVAQKDAATMAVGFTELAYDIWAGTGDVFSSLEEAMDAVRSTIGGETESIQRAGFSVIESTLKETAARHGLAVNIEKATMAEKTYLRYLTLVDQAHARSYVGVYAAEMKTAEGAIRSLTQSVKTLSQAFGQLFIPVLELVIPYITAFVEIVTDGVRHIAGLFGIELFQIDWRTPATGMESLGEGAEGVANGLSGAAAEAKKLKHYTMGFDELNVIDPNSGSSGPGAAGAAGNGNAFAGMDLDTLWNEKVFEQASQKVAELKQKIKDFAEEHKIMLSVVGSVGAIFAFAKAIRVLNALLGITKTWGGLVTVWSGISTAVSKLGGLFGGLQTFVALLKEGAGLGGTLAATFPNLANAVSAVVKWFAPLGTAVQAVAGFLGLPVWAVAVGIIAAIGSVVYYLYENWESVVNVAKAFFETNIVPKLESIKESWNKITDALSPVTGLFSSIFEELDKIDFFKRLFEGFGTAIETVGGIIFHVVASVVAGAFSSVVAIIEGFVQAVSGIVEIVTGVVRIVANLLTGDFSGAWEAAKDTVMGVVDLFVGLYDMTIGAVVKFVEGVIDWFVELWDELVGHSIVPDMIDAIVEWFAGMPERVFKSVEEFAKGVIQRCKDLWSDIKGWFNTNIAPKFTKKYWADMFDSIRQGVMEKIRLTWDMVKAWWNGNVAPKFTLTYWVDQFKNLKEGFTQTIKNMLNSGIDMLNKFIGWLNSKLNFSWDGLTIAGKEIFPGGSVQLFTIPTITQRFEKGGFIEDGLFTMNHGEIAGRFGNGKSVVANNQQIVEGIAAGVYSAVVAAMNATSGGQSQSVNVYLDGKQIYSSMKKVESERGLSLMGNQLGYAY